VIVRKGAAPDGSVRIGATVVVRVNGNERVYEITGSSETDPGSGKVSHLSPLGKALLGKKAGETALVKGPAKEVPYTIVEVR
jgi:transcription elongation factor GreA